MHLSGRGCWKCSNNSSNKEREWLDFCNIPNDDKHRQVHLKMNSGKRYIVDGFDLNNNTVYEFLGDYWHRKSANIFRSQNKS